LIRNLSAILSAAGSNFEHVTKANVFLSYMLLLVPTNEVYKTYWGDIKPGRTCVAVKQLPLGMDEETGCMGGCVVSPFFFTALLLWSLTAGLGKYIYAC
jgi:enamine deaminase RidA (YjgF/YER057c/UK114 family)